VRKRLPLKQPERSALAVTATTLSLLAVFVPIGFMGGIVAKFMPSFGFTSAAAIAVSLLVSFTLTPILAAKWLKQTKPGHSSKESALNRWLDARYTKMLVWSVANRAKIFVVLSGRAEYDSPCDAYRLSIYCSG